MGRRRDFLRPPDAGTFGRSARIHVAGITIIGLCCPGPPDHDYWVIRLQDTKCSTALERIETELARLMMAVGKGHAAPFGWPTEGWAQVP